MKRKIKIIISCSLVILSMLTGCTKQETIQEGTDSNQKIDSDSNALVSEIQEGTTASEAAQAESATITLTEEELQILLVKEQIERMSLEEKLAQLFIIEPEMITETDPVLEIDDHITAGLSQYPVGGIIFFAKNLESPEQTKALLDDLKQEANTLEMPPLFLAIDEEGGRVRRIGKKESFSVAEVEPMGQLAVRGEEAVFEAATTIGSYLGELGFNVDFAPDADVVTNPDNNVIGDRSFGADPVIVAACAKAYSDGLHQKGIYSCYKHFPGHGGTTEDSHMEAAFLNQSLEELRQTELVPFATADEAKVDFVMVGHICVPELSEKDTVFIDGVEQEIIRPATLSKQLVTDILRGECHYNGIVVTDSMRMKAVANYFEPGEAAVLAIEAGCDMILLPDDFESAYQGLLFAVETGRIKTERIDESLQRILLAKQSLDIEEE